MVQNMSVPLFIFVRHYVLGDINFSMASSPREHKLLIYVDEPFLNFKSLSSMLTVVFHNNPVDISDDNFEKTSIAPVFFHRDGTTKDR